MNLNFYLNEETRDELIKEKSYKDIYMYISTNYDTGGYDENLFSPYQKALLYDNERELYRKTWYHFINTRLKRFWVIVNHYNAKHHNKISGGIFRIFKKQENAIDEKSITTIELLNIPRNIVNHNHQKYPSKQDPKLSLAWDWYELMDLIDNAIDSFEKNNFLNDVKRLQEVKESVYSLQKPKAKKTTDNRKIDDSVFWELIDQSREETHSDSEFLDILKDKLEAMGTPEIKKFQKLFLEKMNELYHWDVWALAYVVRRGCGDDAFDYFCAWVISQGIETFKIVKEMKRDKLKDIFEEDPQFEEFMYVANEAYENKKYEEMPKPRLKSLKIQGKEWQEDTICESYPDLCRIFEY